MDKVGKTLCSAHIFLSIFGQHYKLSSVERGIPSLVQFHGIDTENLKNVPLKSKILTSWLYIFLFNIFPCFLLNFLCKRFEFKFSSSSTQISFSSQLEVKVSMPVQLAGLAESCKKIGIKGIRKLLVIFKHQTFWKSGMPTRSHSSQSIYILRIWLH